MKNETEAHRDAGPATEIRRGDPTEAGIQGALDPLRDGLELGQPRSDAALRRAQENEKAVAAAIVRSKDVARANFPTRELENQVGGAVEDLAVDRGAVARLNLVERGEVDEDGAETSLLFQKRQDLFDAIEIRRGLRWFHVNHSRVGCRRCRSV